MKKSLSRVVCLCLAILCTCALAQDFDPAFLTQPGENVPPFSVQDTAGRTHTPQSLKGKVVLMVFFATWCPPCQRELKHLKEAVWPDWQNRHDIVLLPLGREHDLDALKAFQEKKQIPFPLAADPQRTVYSHFAKAGIPRSVLIDKEGRIVRQVVGFSPEAWADLEHKIQDLSRN